MPLSRSVMMALVLLSAGSCWLRAETPGGAARRALLVGCTRYPALGNEHQLEGPGNDVVLMSHLLRTRFGFSAEGIVTLAEGVGGEESRPTRANIEREFRRLARESRPADRIVILLAGHGTQQPDEPPDPLDDPEPDGLDEVFMPANTEPAGLGAATLANVIVDDELRVWLAAIQRTGASVWFIADTCHSGTMIRGCERLRQVDPTKLGISAEALEQARRRAEADFGKIRGDRAGADDRFELPAPEGGDLVAIYATQPNEPTLELPLPQGRCGARCHGLLTYTLNEVLAQAKTPLTYRQLVQNIQARYSALDRQFPTPMVEGRGQAAIILGEARTVAGRIRLVRDDQRRWAIDAGALHGLTPGTILAVGPPPGQGPGDEIRGYVQVAKDEFQAHRALVEACADPESSGPVITAALTEGGLCWPVRIEYGEMGLQVAADDRDSRGCPLSASDRQRLAAVVCDLQAARAPRGGRWQGEEGEERGSLIRVVAVPNEADWLLHLRSPGEDGLYLMPASGLAQSGGEGGPPPLFGPAQRDPDVDSWLRKSLAQIAGARNLLRIAGGAQGLALGDSAGLGLDVAMLRYAGAGDRQGRVLAEPGRAIELRNGDVIGFRLQNAGRDAIDVTLLLVDSSYGIEPLFPFEPGQDNRLRPRDALTRRFRVTVNRPGLEHLVVIAVRARPEELPTDFSFLTQPSLDQVRAFCVGRGHSQRGFDSPLGRLLQKARYAGGNTRSSYSPLDLDDCAMRVISWRTARP